MTEVLGKPNLTEQEEFELQKHKSGKRDQESY
jgi:hypothetical protein